MTLRNKSNLFKYQVCIEKEENLLLIPLMYMLPLGHRTLKDKIKASLCT